MRLRDLFASAQPLVGMVHLQPLPGSPRWDGSMPQVVERAIADAVALAEGGMDGVIVENFGDAPFFPGAVPPETVAAMAVAVGAVVDAVRVPVGVNVLRNDAAAALGVAVATGAGFIRVNVHTGAMLGDQGWLTGHAHDTLRSRAALGADVAILADVMVKHATPPPGLDVGQAARDTWHRGLADALLVSGPATGSRTDPGRLRRVRDAVPEAPVWIASGLAPENAIELLALADGAIVGSALERDGVAGNPVDRERVRRLLEVVRGGEAGDSIEPAP